MNCVMSTLRKMMPNKRDSEQIKHFHKNMQPIQNKDDGFKEKYFAILVKYDKLVAELEEHRNLIQLFDKNKETCEEAEKKIDNFMQLVFARYEEVKRFKTEEVERNMRRICERENVKKEFQSLLERMKEKDDIIEEAKSKNKKLMEQLANGERDYQELIEERRSTKYELEQELALTKEKLQTVSDTLESTKQEKSEKTKELENIRMRTIATIERNTEQFNRYMDQVADLHSEINKIILRSNSTNIKITHPVRSDYNEQLRAMRDSIGQLDELTSKAMEGRVPQEVLDDINRENEQLRGELEELWHREEAKIKTLKVRCYYNDLRRKELEKHVNNYAKMELARQENIHLLHNQRVQLTAENSQFQDQIKVLLDEVSRLQDERDNAIAVKEEATNHLDSETLESIHKGILLKDKLKDFESQVANRSCQIILLNKRLERVKKDLLTNMHLIQNSNCLMTLLKELDHPILPNLECRDELIS